MHRAKLIMSWSLCAWVSAGADREALVLPDRLATGVLPGPEAAAEQPAASTTASAATVRRRPPGDGRRR